MEPQKIWVKKLPVVVVLSVDVKSVRGGDTVRGGSVVRGGNVKSVRGGTVKSVTVPPGTVKSVGGGTVNSGTVKSVGGFTVEKSVKSGGFDTLIFNLEIKICCSARAGECFYDLLNLLLIYFIFDSSDPLFEYQC